MEKEGPLYTFVYSTLNFKMIISLTVYYPWNFCDNRFFIIPLIVYHPWNFCDNSFFKFYVYVKVMGAPTHLALKNCYEKDGNRNQKHAILGKIEASMNYFTRLMAIIDDLYSKIAEKNITVISK